MTDQRLRRVWHWLFKDQVCFCPAPFDRHAAQLAAISRRLRVQGPAQPRLADRVAAIAYPVQGSAEDRDPIEGHDLVADLKPCNRCARAGPDRRHDGFSAFEINPVIAA